VVGLAAVLRGFTGFGLALAAVPGLTLVLPPAEAVPCVLLLQIAAGAQLVPGTRNAIDWGALAPILIGAIAATPIGTVLLAGVPADAMRAAIGLVLLAAVVLLTRRPLVARRPSLAARGAIGIMSGVLNGSTAMAGPPVIAYFLAASASHAAGRASLLAYFFLISIASLVSALAAGLVTVRIVVFAAALLPFMAIGNAVGHRLFGRASPAAYRRIALATLSAMAVLAIARALLR